MNKRKTMKSQTLRWLQYLIAFGIMMTLTIVMTLMVIFLSRENHPFGRRTTVVVMAVGYFVSALMLMLALFEYKKTKILDQKGIEGLGAVYKILNMGSLHIIYSYKDQNGVERMGDSESLKVPRSDIEIVKGLEKIPIKYYGKTSIVLDESLMDMVEKARVRPQTIQKIAQINPDNTASCFYCTGEVNFGDKTIANCAYCNTMYERDVG